MTAPAPYEETGRTTLELLQRYKLITDEHIFKTDETMPREVQNYKKVYKILNENGDADQAKIFADIIEGVEESCAKLQKHRRHATQEMTKYAASLSDFEKDDADTTAKMKGDI